MTTTKAKATTKATPRTRKPRATTTAPATDRFPNSLLAYLDIAVDGPLGSGGVAHRITKYPATQVDDDGRRVKTHLIGGACQPTTTRPIPDEPEETVPVTVCRIVSAAMAQSLGVTRCTDTRCWPIQPGEIPRGAQ